MLLELIIDMPDMPNAACLDVAPEVFFPRSGESGLDAQAKSICAGCPERLACLDYALGADVEGVWGGLNETERDRLAAKKSGVKLCRKGHVKTPENTTNSGTCRTCARAAWRRHYDKKKAVA